MDFSFSDPVVFQEVAERFISEWEEDPAKFAAILKDDAAAREKALDELARQVKDPSGFLPDGDVYTPFLLWFCMSPFVQQRMAPNF